MKAIRCPRCHDLNVEEYNPVGIAKCAWCKQSFTQFDEGRDLFHQLWTFAKAETGYRKDLWNRLRDIIGF